MSTIEYETHSALRQYMMRVFAWMFLALSVTGIVAYTITSSPSLLNTFSTGIIFFGVLGLELLAVLLLSSMVDKLSPAVARVIFISYSVMNGITFTGIFTYFSGESVAIAFFVSAATLGLMSTYGFFSGSDLSGWDGLLLTGLLGIVIASLVNIFLKTSMLSWISSMAGVIIFSGLVAYDTQKVKDLYFGSATTNANKHAIAGALALYLDFINVFLFFVRLLGKRRNGW